MERLYYSISEVAAKLGVGQHALRYWEQEITHFKIKRTGERRMYTPAQVATLKLVHDLLYKYGFTIAGASRFLDAGGKLHRNVERIEVTAKVGTLDVLVMRGVKNARGEKG